VNARTVTLTVLSLEDGRGRRRYRADWTDPDGIFRPEAHEDGRPVGFRRALVSHGNIEDATREWQARGYGVVRVTLPGARRA